MIRKKTPGTIALNLLRCAICLIFAVIILVPILWVVLSSFRQTKDFLTVKPSLIPPVFTSKQYTELFRRIDVVRYIKNSLIYAFSRTAGNIFFCSMAGFIMGTLLSVRFISSPPPEDGRCGRGDCFSVPLLRRRWVCRPFSSSAETRTRIPENPGDRCSRPPSPGWRSSRSDPPGSES